MTNQEFTRVRTMLQNIWPKIPFFDSPDTTDLFFNVLNRYDFRDTWSGIRECVEEAQFQPSLAEIKGYIERSESNRHQDERQNARETWNNAVRCTKCNDVGYVFVKHEDGTEAVMPCNCAAARARFPSLFSTDEERQKWVEDERRKGRNPPTGKPGLSAQQMKEYCGEIIEMAPGRRPPAPPMRFEEKG